MKVTTVGLDLAKSVFTLHGVDERGNTALRKTVRRAKVREVFGQLPACVVGMESCSGAQHWARELRQLVTILASWRLSSSNPTAKGARTTRMTPHRALPSTNLAVVDFTIATADGALSDIAMQPRAGLWGLTFDMSGRRRQAKPAGACPLMEGLGRIVGLT